MNLIDSHLNLAQLSLVEIIDSHLNLTNYKNLKYFQVSTSKRDPKELLSSTTPSLSSFSKPPIPLPKNTTHVLLSHSIASRSRSRLHFRGKCNQQRRFAQQNEAKELTPRRSRVEKLTTTSLWVGNSFLQVTLLLVA